jgi:hypothetical protein
MRIFVAILFSLGIFSAGYYWQKNHIEVIELSLDIGFRALQRLAYDEDQLALTTEHMSESVTAELTMKGRRTTVLLKSLPKLNGQKFSAIKVMVDEKDEFEPRHMLLLNKQAVSSHRLSSILQEFIIQEAPLYVNGKKLSLYVLIAEPFYRLVAMGNGPIARRVSGEVELSNQSQVLPIMQDILKRESAKIPSSLDNIWWYWKKDRWIQFGPWPHSWPL